MGKPADEINACAEMSSMVITRRLNEWADLHRLVRKLSKATPVATGGHQKNHTGNKFEGNRDLG